MVLAVALGRRCPERRCIRHADVQFIADSSPHAPLLGIQMSTGEHQTPNTGRAEDQRPLADRRGWVAQVYRSRFPLLTFVAIIGLCAGACGVFGHGLKALTHNIFDISWFWGLSIVSFMAFLAGAVVGHTLLLVLGNRDSQVVIRLGAFDNHYKDRYWLIWPVVLGVVVALPVAITAILVSTHPRTGEEVRWAVSGIVGALVCVLVAYLLQWVFRWPAGKYKLPSQLVAAVALLVVTVLIYFGLGAAKFDSFFERPLVPAVARVPALVYILLLAMIFCWLLSGAAFFLDRYPIPVLVPFVLVLALNAFLPGSDYLYPVTDPDQEGGSSSSGGPGKIGEGSEGKIIVVAANGGGIQAAAWTAQVLTGLEKECRDKCDLEFDQSVRLISSVSGGSIGTMYFLNEYEGGRLPKDDELEAIVDRTEGSSLDEISWGVLYPDLIRTFLPFNWVPVWGGWDRGRALETAWLRNDTSWNARKGIKQGLSTWRKDAEERNRPAVIFNTAVVETGQRLPLATTELPKDSPGDLSYRQYFGDIESKPDIRVVTAARLSASFPYVSPAARAAGYVRTDHLVDGGYYDNYGISSLVEWLDEELQDNSEVKEVLVLEIRGASSGLGDARGTESPKCKTEPVVIQEEKRTWFSQNLAPRFSQILAPPQGALNVRNTGQRTHNDTELDLLQEKWSAKKRNVKIKRALFEFDGANPPLSWHLTDDQKENIRAEWNEEVNDPSDSCAGWDRVHDFLSSDRKSTNAE
jgi:hypothetical protein